MSSSQKSSPQPMVSIAMCTYNGEDFLDDQIQSIIDQTFQDFEIVIVDDCSTDNTISILEQWGNRYPTKIKIYKNESNLGYNKNFEKAISLSEGDYIAISDQDDIWIKDKIQKLLNSFNSEDVVLSHCASVNLEDGKLLYKSGTLKWENPFSGNNTSELFFLNKVQGHNMIFKQVLKKHILPIPSDFYYDWWIAVIATCVGTINSVPEYLVQHRLHKNNAFYAPFTSKIREEKLSILNALEKFSIINILSKKHKALLLKMINALNLHLKDTTRGMDFTFFKFLLSHSRTIFRYKKRTFPELTYLKSSIKYAKK